MDTEHNPYKRSILYYPTINVPSGSWFKQSLLYWDQVSSIVPADRDGNEKLELNSDITYLLQEHEFQPVFPEPFFQNWQRVKSFSDELVETLDSPKFLRMLLPVGERRFSATIHKFKMNYEILEILERRGLIFDRDRNIYHGRRRWVRVENIAALVYMGILAKHIGRTMHFTPGTDQAVYEHVIFAPLEPDDRRLAAQLSLRELLPIPHAYTPVQEIVAFKRKRRDELLRFRQEIDEVNNQLIESQSEEEVHEKLTHFHEKITQGKKDLEKTMEEQRILGRSGTLNVILGISTSAAAGWLASQLVENPAAGAVAFIGTGAVQLTHYWLTQKYTEEKTLRDSPYSYLYFAERDSIIASHPNTFA
jgi:hypothetical protein